MRTRRAYTSAELHRIAAMREDGRPDREIAAAIGRSTMSVVMACNRYRDRVPKLTIEQMQARDGCKPPIPVLVDGRRYGSCSQAAAALGDRCRARWRAGFAAGRCRAGGLAHAARPAA